MSETKWTIESLAEFLGARIDGLRELMDERTKATDRALEKAEFSLEERLRNTNEWRQVINDIVKSKAGEASGRRDFWGYIVGAAGVITALMVVFSRFGVK